VIAQAVPVAGSRATPMGTTWGLPSRRSVVTVHRCRSRQNATSSAEKVGVLTRSS